MARTSIALDAFDPNASIADPSGTAVDATNGHVVPVTGDWPNAGTEEIIVRVANGVTSMDVTVLAGPNPPALEAGLGNRVETVAGDATRWLGPFSSSRFMQEADDAAGDAAGLWIDVSDDTDGTITAFHLPRTA